MLSMDMGSVVKENPILAIFRNIPQEIILDYTDTVIKGGIRFFEVALNGAQGVKEISMLRERFGDQCIIGAGTAITTDLVKQAKDAGAEFFLTPGTPPDVLEYCAGHGLPMLPGVYTPSDVATCLEFGYKTMKLFPADCVPEGYLQALHGPFDEAQYMAIGGVCLDNIRAFFDRGYIGVGMASSLMPKEILEKRDWEAGKDYISELVRRVR